LNAGALESLIVASNLKQGLASEQFWLAWQPRWTSRPSRVTGVEALVRWNHPALGLILPSQFIAVGRKDRVHRRARCVGARRRMPAHGGPGARAGIAPPAHRDQRLGTPVPAARAGPA
jgi:predicted signal transduction protein with EAL and GGDEF domain